MYDDGLNRCVVDLAGKDLSYFFCCSKKKRKNGKRRAKFFFSFFFFFPIPWLVGWVKVYNIKKFRIDFFFFFFGEKRKLFFFWNPIFFLYWDERKVFFLGSFWPKSLKIGAQFF